MLNDGIPEGKSAVATATASCSCWFEHLPEVPAGGTGEPPMQTLRPLLENTNTRRSGEPV